MFKNKRNPEKNPEKDAKNLQNFPKKGFQEFQLGACVAVSPCLI